MQPFFLEQRQFFRVEQRFRAVARQLAWHAGDVVADESIELQPVNLSAGGLWVTQPLPFLDGTLLAVELSIPGWTEHKSDFFHPSTPLNSPWVAVAQLVHRPPGWVVKFVNVDADHQRALDRFLRALQPK